LLLPPGKLSAIYTFLSTIYEGMYLGGTFGVLFVLQDFQLNVLRIFGLEKGRT
jgi:hypothetical protein